MTIHLYDGMAVCRRKFDFDPFGKGPRTLVNEMLALPKSEVALWCWEGKGSIHARRDLFPDYKLRPSTMTDGLMSLVNLTRDALKHTRAIQIAVPGREADDVIAHLCDTYGPTTKVVVHTIDRDLLALQTGNVTVDVKPLKVIVDNSDHTKDVTIDPAEIRLFKALCGDPSDKIPGMKGFGGKSYVACDRRLLSVAMQSLVMGQPHVELFVKAGVKEAMAQRMCEPAQAELLRTFWTIVGFMQLPGNWEDGITPGREDARAADQILKEFMH